MNDTAPLPFCIVTQDSECHEIEAINSSTAKAQFLRDMAGFYEEQDVAAVVLVNFGEPKP